MLARLRKYNVSASFVNVVPLQLTRRRLYCWYKSPENLNLPLNTVDKSNFCNRDSGGYVRGLPGVYVRTVLPETRSLREEQEWTANIPHTEWSVATGGLGAKSMCYKEDYS